MDRIAVKSSNVAGVGYDAATLILEVEFKSGSVYQYFGVPAVVAQSLLSAPSVGGYLAQNIKKVYRFARIA